MTDYRVSGYTSDRDYHRRQTAYSEIVHDDPNLPAAYDRAMKRAGELFDEVRSLRRFRVEPIRSQP